MRIRSLYIVSPGGMDMADGSAVSSRKLTAHDSHASAVDECHRRLSQRDLTFDRYAIYRAVTVVQRAESPVEVCAILEDGEVSC